MSAPAFRHDSGRCGDEHDPAPPDLDDASLTENTRASYPLPCTQYCAVRDGRPSAQCDLPDGGCLWVMPPIARLTEDQAMFHFISGYTPRLRDGKGCEGASATFSACFGAPFMVRHPLFTPNCWQKRSRSTRRTAGWSTPVDRRPYGRGRE